MTERRDPENVEAEMLEDGPLLGDEGTQQQESQKQSPKHRRFVEWFAWGVLMFLCFVALFDNIRLRQKQSRVSAFGTDLSKSSSKIMNEGSVNTNLCYHIAAAKHVSELIEYQFTGGIQVDHEGKLYREVNPMEPQYAGEPVPEIDTAWEHLLSG